MTRTFFLLLAAVCATIAVVAPAHASTSQEVTFEAPRDLLGAEARPEAWNELDAFGVRSLRIMLFWKDVAPERDSRIRPDQLDLSDPASYDWSKYESAIAEAHKRGWKTQLTVTGPVPRWATNGARDNVTRPSPTSFAQFVTAVSRKFGSQIDRYAIWNEPNHPEFLQPQYDYKLRPVSPGIYRRLYSAALRGLAAAGDTKPVLMAETAPNANRRKVVDPIGFLRGSLCLSTKFKRNKKCKKLRVDGWAHHAYPTRSGPLGNSPSTYVTIGQLGRMTSALDRAAKAGAVRKGLPLYLTEFGVQSFPDKLTGVSQTKQNEYRAISEKIAYDNPRVRAFSQYLLTDDKPTGKHGYKYGGFESGLILDNGKKKLAYDGFRLPVVAERRGGRVRLWGIVRPPGGQATVTIERGGKGGWKKLKTLTTDGRGVWSMNSADASGARWRAVWTAPDGHVYKSPGVHAYTWPKGLR